MRTSFAFAALSLALSLSAAVIGCSGAGTGGTVDVPCEECFGHSLSWGPTGGLTVAYVGSTLSSCRSYTHTRTPFAGGSGEPTEAEASCSNEIGDCAAAYPAVHDVELALAQPGVPEAFAGSVAVYGSDPRPCDGSVLQITLDGKTVFVGGDCASEPACGQDTCVPVPQKLRDLADTLQDLDALQLTVGDCASTFSSP